MRNRDLAAAAAPETGRVYPLPSASPALPAERPALTPEAKPKQGRIEAIDFARGLAVTLMILSHGVKGLLTFEQFPAWGLVPIHLITKFSSSLFFLVFGLSLAIVHLPAVGTARWPAKRTRLLVRGIKILFWYKVLTIVEMFALYSREDILNTLTYSAFPVYVEILGYYAIALLWIPFALPAWKKTPLALKLAAPLLAGVGAYYAHHYVDFGSVGLQAILVEHQNHYTWGQLTRLPLVLLGVLVGEFYLWNRDRKGNYFWPSAISLGAAALLLGAFYWLKETPLAAEFLSFAMNEGKHPPERDFTLFSVGGAFLLLSLSFFGGNFLARALRPITIIGQDALQAFVCHIFVIFVFYRYLFDYFHKTTYEHALLLTGLLIGITAVWIKTVSWVKVRS